MQCGSCAPPPTLACEQQVFIFLFLDPGGQIWRFGVPIGGLGSVSNLMHMLLMSLMVMYDDFHLLVTSFCKILATDCSELAL